jgi:hypothetical protein
MQEAIDAGGRKYDETMYLCNYFWRCAWPHLWCKLKEIEMLERKVAICFQNLTFEMGSEKHIIGV